MQDLTGQTLGQYRIIEPLGQGGMASVFKAFQPSLERYVAIKVLPPYYVHEQGFAERFIREAKAVARLEHPHILPVYDFGREGDYTFIAMKYVPAGTLKDMIVAGAVETERAIEIIEHLAQALDYAHEQGIIHRDVKPSNVLMDRGDWALLMDFGLAKMVEGSVQLTASGVGVGTPAYMSPEQGQGKKADHRADIYSLGVVLYEMLTGRVPFDAETPMAVVIKHITEPLPMPRLVNPAIPEQIELVILKALAKDPQDRYQSCGEMSAALKRAAQAVPLTDILGFDQRMPPSLSPVEKLDAFAPLPIETAPAVEAAPPKTVVEPKPPPAVQASVTQVEPEPAVPATRVLPKKRKIPWWAWAGGVIALLVVAAVAVGAALIVLGLGEDETLPGDGSDEEAVRVAPCEWDGLGNGLCIYSLLEEKAPTKILQDAGFQHINDVSWSPEGRQLVVSGIRSDAGEVAGHSLFIVNADGTDLRQITSTENNTAPSWSPDGEWIVFHRNCDLARIHSDGSGLEVIWPGNGQCASAPQWSPDGEWVVFSAMSNVEWVFPLTRSIYVIGRDGGEATLIAVTDHADEEHLRAEAAFSPDGAQIAYIDGENHVYVVGVENPDESESMQDFPYSWLSTYYPQWSGE